MREDDHTITITFVPHRRLLRVLLAVMAALSVARVVAALAR